MAKAIYTKIGDTYYKMNQDARRPNTMTQLPVTTVSVGHDKTSSLSSVIVNVNCVDPSKLETNIDMATKMKEALVANKVLNIKPAQNRFMLSVTYSLVDEDDNVFAQHVIIKPLKVTDCVLALGVDENDDCGYIRVKSLTRDVDILFDNKRVPYGIIHTRFKTKKMIITDIKVFQDMRDIAYPDTHESIYENSYNLDNLTLVEYYSDNITTIYSSHTEGVELTPIEINDTYRASFRFNLVIGNYIVVYDDTTVDSILATNNNPAPEPTEP